MNNSKDDLKLKLSQFFPLLKDEDMDQFLTICKYKSVGNKKVILKGGSTRKNVLLLLSGSARAFSLDEKGEEVNSYIRYEGHLIADARVFGDDVQVLSVESMGELDYLKFNIGELEELGFENTELMKFYLNFLKEIILTLSHRVRTFVSMSPKERYADLLRWNPKYLGTAFDKDVASFIGVKPITLYRIKKEV